MDVQGPQPQRRSARERSCIEQRCPQNREFLRSAGVSPVIGAQERHSAVGSFPPSGGR
jgi:hypothetical protein